MCGPPRINADFANSDEKGARRGHRRYLNKDVPEVSPIDATD